MFLGSMKVISDLLHYSGSLEMCYKPFSFTVRIQSLICLAVQLKNQLSYGYFQLIKYVLPGYALLSFIIDNFWTLQFSV